MLFDFRVMNSCQYEVADQFGNVFDCGEPAPYQVWWESIDKDSMYVCTKHFKYIYSCEGNEVESDIEL